MNPPNLTQKGILSVVNNAYTGKHQAKTRPDTGAGKSKSRFGTMTYYPEEYYQRLGYQRSAIDSDSYIRRTDTLGQRVRQRFNEEVNYENLPLTAKKLDRKNLD